MSFVDLVPQPTAMSPQTALSSHPPSSRMHRSTTAPKLPRNTEPSGSNRPASRDAHVNVAANEEGNDNSEICLSPSWSEFGNKKKKDKKKVERERKEHEKKQKKEREQQKAMELKAGKRLSKKPPAAMDTQKMPYALRRNSGHSFTTQEGSQRSSREENRSSGISTYSKDKRRSQSTPATSTDMSQDAQRNIDTIISSTAPQIPAMRNFSWHSQHSSSGNSSGGDLTYEKALVDFAYRLEASTTTNDSQHSPTVTTKDSRPSTQSHPPTKDYQPSAQPAPGPQLAKDRRPSTQPTQGEQIYKPFTRSHTAPDLQLNLTQDSSDKSMVRLSPFKHASHADEYAAQEYGRPNSSHRQTNMVQQMSDEIRKVKPEEKTLPDEFLRAGRKTTGNDGQKAQTKLHYDGSSYVHKQRMYQQQRSIAGFQDELAIRDANDPRFEYEVIERRDPSTVPSRSVSSDSSKPPTRQTSIDCDCRPEDLAVQQEVHNQHHASPKESKDLVIVNQPQGSLGSKAEKILGFRRFQRKGKQTGSLAPLTPTIPATNSSTNSRLTLQPSTSASTAIPEKKSPTAERILGEPTRSPADTTSVATQKQDPSEGYLEKPPVQNHSRSRTSSSQLLNDYPLSKPLSRSTTAPELPKIPKLANENSDQQTSGHAKPASPVRMTPQGPRSPPGDIRAPTKNTPEIIVEGVTGEGLVHKTSIKRHRSNPMLQTIAPSNPLPSLDFLPQLRHQPLTKPKRTSPVRPSSSTGPAFPATAFPAGSSPAAKSFSEPHLPSMDAPELKLSPRSPLRPPYQPKLENALVHPGNGPRRRTMDPTGPVSKFGPLSFAKGGAEGVGSKPIAKLFVICCKCKFWHDLPSKMYELMVPQKLSRQDSEENPSNALGKASEATLDTMVKCPWCDHFMTTWCCAGWTTVVYLHERHH